MNQKIVDVLLISPFDQDHERLRLILRHLQWRLHGTRTLKEALAFLKDNPTPVVICESELPDGTWKDAAAQFDRMLDPPMLVVTSGVADDALWSEVLNMGGYNVLAKPLEMREVFHVVNSAWLAWKSQWELARRHALMATA